MKRPRYRDLPIAAKLLGPFVVSMIVWGVLGTQVLLSGSVREAGGIASTRLATALEFGRSSFSTASARLIETARFAAHTVGVAEALQARDSETLRLLLEGVAANANHAGLQIVDPNGSVIVTIRLVNGLPQSATGGRADQPVVRAAASGGITTESTVALDTGSVLAVVPAKSLDGTVVGAIVAFDDTSKIVREMAGETGPGLTLYSTKGTLLASTGWAVPFRSVAREGLRTGKGRGNDRIEALYAPLTASGATLGVIGLGIPLREAAPGGGGTFALGLLVVAAVLLAFVIGWKASRSVAVPVGNLVEATKALEHGDLSTRATVDSRDEVGRLAESFNVMAAELQASHESLERKVAERTAELERVNEQLARASDAKSSFLATMSHELRTPLNAVIGFADFLSDPAFGSPDTKDVRRISQDIKASGTHLLTLINDLLDLAKIEAGKVEIEPRPVHVRDVMRDVESVCRPLAAAKNVRLTFRCPARLPEASADPGRLRQILLNLIGNAIKFTPHGGKVVASAFEDAGRIAVTVADTGAGMTASEAAVIFEPFERTAGARGVEGTGLGLALTRRFVEMHGGTIGVESRSGKGSVFRFTLPVAAPTPAARRASGSGRRASASQRKSA